MAKSDKKWEHFLQSNKIRLTIIILSICFITLPVTARTLTFDNIDWFNVGTGGQSSSGGYNLNGTLGQHDTGIMSDGEYVLNGGFWAQSIDPTAQPSLNEVYLPLLIK